MDSPIRNKKRPRENSDDFLHVDAKRLEADLLLDIILEDDTDSGSTDEDVATVIRRLEAEIGFSPSLPQPAEMNDIRLPELGYLLEASDDELGLPLTESVPSASLGEAGAVSVLDGQADDAGLGKIRWFDDDNISACYGTGMGLENIVEFDGEMLYYYSDDLLVPSDFSDSLWWPESLPAV